MQYRFKMHYPFIMMIGCAAIMLLHGASCSLFPNAVVEMLAKNKEHKRQANTQIQCINNQLNIYFQGNTSQFVTNCKAAATEEVELDFSDRESVQEHITRFFTVFCDPECGNAVNDAYRRCDAYTPGAEDLNIDLCGINQNGIECYLLYGRGLDLISTEANCYNAYVSSDVCTCRSQLLSGIAEQGCCVDAYHDFIAGLSGAYNPQALYRACNVNRPAGCNNSPFLPESSSTTATTWRSGPDHLLAFTAIMTAIIPILI